MPDVTDPTAGERARMIQGHPHIPVAITDPTDPRYGAFAPSAEALAIQDPTNPRFGDRMP
jgi:hypothetical protein